MIISHFDGEHLLDDLETLGQIGASPEGGLNRIAYSPADREGRSWFAEQMRRVGMTVQTDVAGNDIGRYPGTDPQLAPIALGSHTDTVPNGGRYDGTLGVLAALACVRTLHEAKVQLRHPIEVINFAAEEATMAGATFGSRAMVGLLDAGAISQQAWDGRAVAEHLQAANLEPSHVSQAKRSENELAAYLELHIEQGRKLESAQVPIGVVEGIVGIRRYGVTFHGYANHAGTTLMADRQDALVMAASYILGVRDIAQAHGIVGTVGILTLKPGAPNVIPGQVDINVEIRGLHEDVLDTAEAELAQEAQKVDATFQHISNKPPVESDPRLVDALIAACAELDLPYQRMPSGAGHDAMLVAHIAPQAMLFVPSRNGVSHSPDEYTDPESCVAGARVLLAALLKLDEQLDSHTG
ncbi:Zn-dependent hydrolase [Chloroflexi bacterium TSY]|nr:Zn-dependent hydrolase [Chloroflexi bacterium TSY]